MKFFILLFTTGLLFISHYDKIRKIVSSSQTYANRADLTATAPKLEISSDELDKHFSPIAEKYNLTGSVVIHFIVSEEGAIRHPSLPDMEDPGVSKKIIELIETAGVKPGMVSGKPTSNGMCLELSPDKS